MTDFPLLPCQRIKPLTPERLDWLAAKARAVKIEQTRRRINAPMFKLFQRWVGRDTVNQGEP